MLEELERLKPGDRRGARALADELCPRRGLTSRSRSPLACRAATGRRARRRIRVDAGRQRGRIAPSRPSPGVARPTWSPCPPGERPRSPRRSPVRSGSSRDAAAGALGSRAPRAPRDLYRNAASSWRGPGEGEPRNARGDRLPSSGSMAMAGSWRPRRPRTPAPGLSSGHHLILARHSRPMATCIGPTRSWPRRRRASIRWSRAIPTSHAGREPVEILVGAADVANRLRDCRGRCGCAGRCSRAPRRCRRRVWRFARRAHPGDGGQGDPGLRARLFGVRPARARSRNAASRCWWRPGRCSAT